MTDPNGAPAGGRIWRTGEPVLITYGGRQVVGRVTLASANGRSLMLGFEGVLGGHAGSMPVLQDDAGTYRSLMTREPAQLAPVAA